MTPPPPRPPNSRDQPVAGRVSVVVLNWNSGELGERAVASAMAQNWPDVEVVVVDNASADDSLDRIVAAHPEVVVVRNDENLGFAGGMDSGIEVTTGEYVLPLNCDAELAPDYCRILAAVLARRPRAAGAGGRVESSRVDASGPLRITTTMRTASLPLDRARRCDKLNGACPLFRAAALREVTRRFGGPYDASYFTYGEDVDLALTLARLGWELWYEPSASASHVRSYSSAPRLADRRGRLRTSTLSNRHRNIVRHGRSPWWVTLAGALVQDLGFAVLRAARGDLGATADVVRAWRATSASLPHDRAKRARLPEPGWMSRLDPAARPDHSVSRRGAPWPVGWRG